MATDPRDAQSSATDDQTAEFKSIKEALKQPREDILITQSRELSISPEEGEYSNLLHRIQIRSFDDLQRLTFIPDKLHEKRTLDALAIDDASALSAAQDYLHTRGKSCACQNSQSSNETQMKASYRLDLRTTYEDIRRWHNPQLARVLTEVFRKDIAWDSPIVAHVRGWVHRWQLLQVIPIWIFIPNDMGVTRTPLRRTFAI